ncbi:(d)CMP kinase [Candidatus Endowatersipora endosymbiont of Watersipora subatra]|uniref:(d)CMP kinase n=1 Tax=Candidatus Endowatersipora endosymbiont of Watersipora subatra TaxID=3077946 RepID=UPI00312CB403
MPKPKHFIITIDGPAASGKGTVSRLLADHLKLPYLDTGLSYRAVAHVLKTQKKSLDNIKLAEQVAKKIDFNDFNKDLLSRHPIGNAASKIAVMGSVRRILVQQQRNFANIPPGAILDGRDVGTIVCPDAQVKFYIIASDTIRAKRRWEEMMNKREGKTENYDRILEDIRQRDTRDQSREDSPLHPANDAYLIDTSKMSIEEMFRACLEIVNRHKYLEI